MNIGKILTSDPAIILVEVLVLLLLVLLMVRSAKRHRKLEAQYEEEVKKRKDIQLDRVLHNRYQDSSRVYNDKSFETLTVLVRMAAREERGSFPAGQDITIGREAGCDLRLHSVYAARRQFDIRWERKAPVLYCLGTKNPSVLKRNGSAIRLGAQPEQLKPHDQVTMGDTTLEFIFSGI